MKQLFCFLIIACVSVELTAGQLECAAGANTCAETLFNVESTASTSAEICEAVDVAILCIANATASCDPVAAADVASSMSAIIDEYKAAPNNCILENENNPAFQLDPCTEGLAYCSEVLYQASIASDMTDGCRLKDVYKECMIVNTTTCDSSMQPTIDTNILEAENTYNKQPFFCQQRIATDMTACDSDYANCNSGLTSIGVSAQTSNEVCPLVTTFSTCIDNLPCPTVVKDYYVEVAVNLTESFKDLPYFCGSDNACQELFDACNATLSENVEDPCSLMTAQVACLGNIQPLCETTKFADVKAPVDVMNNAIVAESPTSCLPTTISTTDTSTNPKTNSPSPKPTISTVIAGSQTTRISNDEQPKTTKKVTDSTTTRISNNEQPETTKKVTDSTTTRISNNEQPETTKEVTDSTTTRISNNEQPETTKKVTDSTTTKISNDEQPKTTKKITDGTTNLQEGTTKQSTLETNEQSKDTDKSTQKADTSTTSVTTSSGPAASSSSGSPTTGSSVSSTRSSTSVSVSACQSMFDSCNSTLSDSITESCQVIEVHTQCYNDIATSCDPAELSDLGPYLDQVEAGIRAASPTGCIPTTTPSSNSGTTTQTVSACQTMFNNCNSTLTASIIEPCQVIEVHTQCYNDIATSCDPAELSNLGPYLDQADAEIRATSPTGCIPTTTTPSATTETVSACQNMFNNCNSTLTASIIEPCQVIEVHTQCYNDIATSCDGAELAQLGPLLDQVDAGIRAASPTGCIPTTTVLPVSSCQSRFDDCNATYSLTDPCNYIDVHTQCYNSIATICDQLELGDVGQVLDATDAAIRANSPTGCVVTTTISTVKTTKEPTTVTSTDTTTSSTVNIETMTTSTTIKQETTTGSSTDTSVTATVTSKTTVPTTTNVADTTTSAPTTKLEVTTVVAATTIDLSFCETQFNNCNSTLSASITEPCNIIDVHNQCYSDVAPTCDQTELGELGIRLDQTDADIKAASPTGCIPTATSTVQTVSACQNMFNNCNSTLTASIIEPCQVIEVHTQCYNDIATSCDATELGQLGPLLDQVEAGIRAASPTGCIPTTTLPVSSCQTRFDDCNATYSLTDPCNYIDVHTQCYNSIATICDQLELGDVGQVLDATDAAIRANSPTGCVVTTTISTVKKTTREPTTVTSTTTTKSSTATTKSSTVTVESTTMSTNAKQVTTTPHTETTPGTPVTATVTSKTTVPTTTNVADITTSAPTTKLEVTTEAGATTIGLSFCEIQFNNCNSTLSASITEPCNIIDVHNQCYSDVAPTCDQTELGELGIRLDQTDADIKAASPTGCIPKTTTPAPTVSACQNMFNNCNSTLTASIIKPCQVIEVHTQCYNDIATSCDATELGQLGPLLDQVDAEIRAASPTGCVPPPVTTTPTPTPISACEAMFNNCNSTLSSGIIELCLVIEVHTQCYNDIATSCDPAELSNLGPYLDQVDASIRSNSPTSCVPTTTLAPTTTQTPTIDNNVQDCFNQVTKCSQFSDLAQTEPDLQKACGFKTLYIECLKVNTTSCDQASQSDISNIILTTENKYNQSPYLCNEVSKATTDAITTTQATVSAKTETTVAVSTTTKPTNTISTTTKPTTVVATSTKPAVTVPTSAKLAITVKTSAKPAVTVKTSDKPTVTVKTSDKPTVTVTASTKPAVMVTNSAKPAVTVITSTKPAVTVTTSTKSTTSIGISQPTTPKVITASDAGRLTSTTTSSTPSKLTTPQTKSEPTTSTSVVSDTTLKTTGTTTAKPGAAGVSTKLTTSQPSTDTSKVPSIVPTTNKVQSGQSTTKDATSLQQSTTPGPPSIFPSCAKGADVCSNTVSVKINGGLDVAQTCLAVDESLGCVADAAKDCDPVSTAEVASILLLVINQFKGAPYSCSLANADNHIFHLGNCITALEHCTDILEQAMIQSDFNQACVLEDNYKECMIVNTTSCDAATQVDITNKIQESDIKFNQATHFCDERQSNDLAFVQGCDNETAVCFAILAQIGRTVFLPDDVCETKTDFMDCMININCPPKMRAYLEERAVTISSDFDHKPYFCSSTNRCLDTFTDCNNTLVEQKNIIDPCGLPEMHQMCLQSIKLGCDVTQWDVLTASVGVEDAAIKDASPTRCGELTTQKSETTTLTGTPTVEKQTTPATKSETSETTTTSTLDKSTKVTNKVTQTKSDKKTTGISIVRKTTPKRQRTTPKYYIHQPTPGHIQQQWHYRHSSATSIKMTVATFLLPMFLTNLFYI